MQKKSIMNLTYDLSWVVPQPVYFSIKIEIKIN